LGIVLSYPSFLITFIRFSISLRLCFILFDCS